ncbi:MAG: mechanosensitive ion channel family protein [Woeseiaceae bacterium]|nr:mechanosensitive ion channel family protein [Woeseiaceae bacterium]
MPEFKTPEPGVNVTINTGPSAVAASGSPTDDSLIQVDPFSLDRFFTIVQDKLITWLDGAVALLPNFLIAVVILVLGFAVGSITEKVARKFFGKAIDSTVIVNLLAAIIKILIILVGFYITLDLIGLQNAVVSLLAGAGIITLAMGFAFQDVAANLLAGVLMGIRKHFEPGDLIRSKGQLGFVQSLNLRNTVIRNFSGQIVYIPNKEVFESVLENFSETGERRIEIDVRVSYGEDLKHVSEVLKSAIEGVSSLKEDKPVDVFALEFGDSSVNFSVRYWVDFPSDKIGYLEATDAGIKAIKEAFDREDILIPFPIRTLDFDAKGGLKLSDSIGPVFAQPEGNSNND